jgi:hypothetical protein
MKRNAVAAGLAALSALGAGMVHAQPHFYSLAPGLTPQELSKPWSISVGVRGFYDDNYNTAARGLANDSFGFEVQPSLSLNLPMEQTYIGLRADYSYRWYEDNRSPDSDHTINFNGVLNHSFSDRLKFSLNDSFALSQEDQLLDTSAVVTSPLRTTGTNFRNRVSPELTVGFSESISGVFTYANTWFNYEQKGVGSRSALLDRLDHELGANLRWQQSPSTVFSVGYLFDLANFTSGDAITLGPPYVSPSSRDSLSHFIFAGVDYSFNAELSGSLRGGYQYSKYPHALPGQSDTSDNPYVDASLSWGFLPGSAVQIGVRHSRAKTDIAVISGGLSGFPTLDQETTTVYGSITHKFTGRLSGSILGQGQIGHFNQGDANTLDENYYLIGVSVGYKINQFLSAEAGYNYDLLDTSIVSRGFHRNRIYIGLRGTY